MKNLQKNTDVHGCITAKTKVLEGGNQKYEKNEQHFCVCISDLEFF